MNLKILIPMLIALLLGPAGFRTVFGGNADLPQAETLVMEEVPNFHRVGPELYRGAQPSQLGLKRLQKFGIRTIVSLRSFHFEFEEVQEMGMSFEQIYMKAWHPEKEDIVRFLKIMNDPQRAPVFLHCQHGADRTGLMIGVYRVTFCGRTKEAAIQEMVEGGYGFHPIWGNLIDFFRNLDIDALRREAGLDTSHSGQISHTPAKSRSQKTYSRPLSDFSPLSIPSRSNSRRDLMKGKGNETDRAASRRQDRYRQPSLFRKAEESIVDKNGNKMSQSSAGEHVRGKMGFPLHSRPGISCG